MEQTYQSLENHLSNLVSSGSLFSYSVIQLGSPQSTGIVQCQELIDGTIYTKLKVFKIVNDEYVSIPLAKYHYIIDDSVVIMDTPINDVTRPYQLLSAEQVEFYQDHPTLSVSEIIRMEVDDTPTISDLRLLKKQDLDKLCHTTILAEYSLSKQLNITNQNGYNENDLFTMNLFIAKQRSKLSLLSGMVDSVSNDSELDNISWEVPFDTLVDTIIEMNIGSSLDVAKLKKFNELKVWDKELTDSGYTDTTTQLTLATRESDVISFTKDLTGLTSLIKEAETNNTINIPSVWPFIDINSSLVNTLTPAQYISLLNRYFVIVRNNKFVYASYLYQIFSASNVSAVNAITFN